MPEALPCDAIFGETTIEGFVQSPIQIAGVLGDSHGALTGQMCFEAGMGKVTYGTGSSVMVNIGEEAVTAPEGLVTSVGFSALGKVYYAFEGISIVPEPLSSGWWRNWDWWIRSIKLKP